MNRFKCPLCDAEEILEARYSLRPKLELTYLKVDGNRLREVGPPVTSLPEIPHLITKFFCGRCGYDIQNEFSDPDDIISNKKDLIQEYLKEGA
jgi:hypothetical protein